MPESAQLAEPVWRPVAGTILVFLGPVVSLLLLTALSGLAYDRADATGDRSGARLVIGLTIALPLLQVGTVLALTRSVAVRVLVGIVAIVSCPVYGGLVFLLSWSHH